MAFGCELLTQCLDGAFESADSPGVIRSRRLNGFVDDLSDDLSDFRKVCPGRVSGARNSAVPAAFAYLFRGDKHADNSIVSDLPRPTVLADKTLGGQQGYPLTAASAA